MQYRTCFNADVPDDAAICSNCGQDPRGTISGRMTTDHHRRLDELEENDDVAGLRDYARNFATNRAVSVEATRRTLTQRFR